VKPRNEHNPRRKRGLPSLTLQITHYHGAVFRAATGWLIDADNLPLILDAVRIWARLSPAADLGCLPRMDSPAARLLSGGSSRKAATTLPSSPTSIGCKDWPAK
jgi:hypothetical protein